MPRLKSTGITVYEGPNIFAPHPVIQYLFQFSGVESRINSEFISEFKNLISGTELANIDELADGDYVAHETNGLIIQLFSECVLELQHQAGDEQKAPLIRYNAKTNYWECYLPFSVEVMARKAATECFVRLNRALEKGLNKAEITHLQTSLQPLRMKLQRMFEAYTLSEPTTEFIQIANRRKIPFKRLPGVKQVLHYGYGKTRRSANRVLLSGESHLAAEIANNKELTTKALAEAGLPVARQIIVRTEQGALTAAKNIGYPVAIKPLVGTKGNGVSPNVKGAEDVPEAFSTAYTDNKQVIVEEHIAGDDFRLQVIGEKYAFGMLRTRAQVVGDGVHSIIDLAEIKNEEPWRRDSRGKMIYGIKQSESTNRCLEKQGLNWETVPAQGHVIFLQDVANVSQGGDFLDLKKNIHPSNVKLAEMAARVVGLQIAGVDFLTTDIMKPYWETGGKICEVNIQPGIDGMSPDPECPSYHFEQAFSLMFPEEERPAIPMAVILEDGVSETVAALDDIFKSQNLLVGRKTMQDVSVGDNLLVGVTGTAASEAVLWNPVVDAVIIQETTESIVASGLGYSVSECIILPKIPTSIDPETLRKTLAILMQTVVQAVIYNADDKQLCDWALSVEQVKCYPVSLTTVSEIFQNSSHVEKLILNKEKSEKMALLLAIKTAEVMGVPLDEHPIT